MNNKLGNFEIFAINEAIGELPEGEYYEELAEGLRSAINLIQTHVLDENDLGAID